jgi:hypothetical protein
MIAFVTGVRLPDASAPTTPGSEACMREFNDTDGRPWVATADEEHGTDYKGRYYLVMKPAHGGEAVALKDVRWNSERSARRTIDTMSLVELRRRLRSAVGRKSPVL